MFFKNEMKRRTLSLLLAIAMILSFSNSLLITSMAAVDYSNVSNETVKTALESMNLTGDETSLDFSGKAIIGELNLDEIVTTTQFANLRAVNYDNTLISSYVPDVDLGDRVMVSNANTPESMGGFTIESTIPSSVTVNAWESASKIFIDFNTTPSTDAVINLFDYKEALALSSGMDETLLSPDFQNNGWKESLNYEIVPDINANNTVTAQNVFDGATSVDLFAKLPDGTPVAQTTVALVLTYFDFNFQNNSQVLVDSSTGSAISGTVIETFNGGSIEFTFEHVLDLDDAPANFLTFELIDSTSAVVPGITFNVVKSSTLRNNSISYTATAQLPNTFTTGAYTVKVNNTLDYSGYNEANINVNVRNITDFYTGTPVLAEGDRTTNSNIANNSTIFIQNKTDISSTDFDSVNINGGYDPADTFEYYIKFDNSGTTGTVDYLKYEHKSAISFNNLPTGISYVITEDADGYAVVKFTALGSGLLSGVQTGAADINFAGTAFSTGLEFNVLSPRINSYTIFTGDITQINNLDTNNDHASIDFTTDEFPTIVANYTEVSTNPSAGFVSDQVGYYPVIEQNSAGDFTTDFYVYAQFQEDGRYFRLESVNLDWYENGYSNNLFTGTDSQLVDLNFTAFKDSNGAANVAYDTSLSNPENSGIIRVVADIAGLANSLDLKIEGVLKTPVKVGFKTQNGAINNVKTQTTDDIVIPTGYTIEDTDYGALKAYVLFNNEDEELINSVDTNTYEAVASLGDITSTELTYINSVINTTTTSNITHVTTHTSDDTYMTPGQYYYISFENYPGLNQTPAVEVAKVRVIAGNPEIVGHKVFATGAMVNKFDATGNATYVTLQFDEPKLLSSSEATNQVSIPLGAKLIYDYTAILSNDDEVAMNLEGGSVLQPVEFLQPPTGISYSYVSNASNGYILEPFTSNAVAAKVADVYDYSSELSTGPYTVSNYSNPLQLGSSYAPPQEVSVVIGKPVVTEIKHVNKFDRPLQSGSTPSYTTAIANGSTVTEVAGREVALHTNVYMTHTDYYNTIYRNILQGSSTGDDLMNSNGHDYLDIYNTQSDLDTTLADEAYINNKNYASYIVDVSGELYFINGNTISGSNESIDVGSMMLQANDPSFSGNFATAAGSSNPYSLVSYTTVNTTVADTYNSSLYNLTNSLDLTYLDSTSSTAQDSFTPYNITDGQAVPGHYIARTLYADTTVNPYELTLTPNKIASSLSSLGNVDLTALDNEFVLNLSVTDEQDLAYYTVPVNENGVMLTSQNSGLFALDYIDAQEYYVAVIAVTSRYDQSAVHDLDVTTINLHDVGTTSGLRFVNFADSNDPFNTNTNVSLKFDGNSLRIVDATPVTAGSIPAYKVNVTGQIPVGNPIQQFVEGSVNGYVMDDASSTQVYTSIDDTYVDIVTFNTFSGAAATDFVASIYDEVAINVKYLNTTGDLSNLQHSWIDAIIINDLSENNLRIVNNPDNLTITRDGYSQILVSGFPSVGTYTIDLQLLNNQDVIVPQPARTLTFVISGDASIDGNDIHLAQSRTIDSNFGDGSVVNYVVDGVVNLPSQTGGVNLTNINDIVNVDAEGNVSVDLDKYEEYFVINDPTAVPSQVPFTVTLVDGTGTPYLDENSDPIAFDLVIRPLVKDGAVQVSYRGTIYDVNDLIADELTEAQVVDIRFIQGYNLTTVGSQTPYSEFRDIEDSLGYVSYATAMTPDISQNTAGDTVLGNKNNDVTIYPYDVYSDTNGNGQYDAGEPVFAWNITIADTATEIYYSHNVTSPINIDVNDSYTFNITSNIAGMNPVITSSDYVVSPAGGVTVSQDTSSTDPTAYKVVGSLPGNYTVTFPNHLDQLGNPLSFVVNVAAPALQISTLTLNTTNVIDTNLPFNLIATPGPTGVDTTGVTYTWMSKAPSGAWVTIAGITGNTFSVPLGTPAGTQFKAVINGTSIESNIATVTSTVVPPTGTTVIGTVVDSSNSPIASATVDITNASGTSVGSTTTDANGDFDITNIPPGTYTLTINDGVTSTTMTITVTGTEPSNTLDLGTIVMNQPVSVVSGNVSSTTGPIAGATVNILVNGQSFSTVTDSSGNYTINNVPQGNATFNATASGYNFASISGVNINLANFTQDITMTPFTGGGGGGGGGTTSSVYTDELTLTPSTVTAGNISNAKYVIKKDGSIFNLSSDATYTWTSSDTSVATVANVNSLNTTVTSLTEGTTTIKIVVTSNGKTFTDSKVLTVNAPTLSDLDGFWAQDEIEYLIDQGIVQGYPDSTFRPNNDITRGEYVAIAVRALKYDVATQEDLENASNHFADWDSIPSWNKEHWAIGLREQVAVGSYNANTNEHTAYSTDPMNRVESTSLFARILNMKGIDTASDLTFTDSDTIPVWGVDYIKVCVENNLINGYPDGSFKPLNNITRAEACVITYNYLMGLE